MVSNQRFRELALSFEDAVEVPHFEKPSFRVKGKIFATLHADSRCGVVKLTPLDQSTFCSFSSEVFFPVPGGWGAKGFTMIDLTRVAPTMLKDALGVAYDNMRAGNKATH